MIRNLDKGTMSHSLRVATLSRSLGNILFPRQSGILFLSGLLHDLGKSQIPVEILHKPARLTPDEFGIMKKHVVFGYEMVRQINAPWADLVSQIIVEHHEDPCGNGYPFGKKEILFEARILAGADKFAALAEDRPYKSGLSKDETVQLIRRFKDMDQLDMAVADLLIREADRFYNICKLVGV